MNKKLFHLLIILALVVGISQGSATAQKVPVCKTQALMEPEGPEICVSLVIPDLRDTFAENEPIEVRLSIGVVGEDDVVTSASFPDDPHLLLHFYNQDGWLVTANQFIPANEPPPPHVHYIAGSLKQVDAVKTLKGERVRDEETGGGWTFTQTFNVLDFYSLGAGDWRATVFIPMRTYPVPPGTKYAQLDSSDWSGTLQSNTVEFSIVSGDSDNDGVPDDVDDCPDVAGPADQNGCPHADETAVTMSIIDLSRSGVCGYKPNGQARINCEQVIENVAVKVFDRDEQDFIDAYGHWPCRHLLDNIFEEPIAFTGACITDDNGECMVGEDHPGKYLVIAKYQDPGSNKTVYTGKFKNFMWNRSGCWWHWDRDDDDQGGVTPPDIIRKHLRIIKMIRRNGSVKFLGGLKTIITGSQLDIYHPEYTIWEGDQELYPFVYTSEENWDVDVCMYVPQGYNLMGILDDNEEVVSTTDCVNAFVAGESKVFLFEVEDVGSPEPELSFTLRAKHKKGKIKKLKKKIDGVRKRNEAKLEKRNRRKIKKLAPKWKKREKNLLKKMKKKKAEKEKKEKKEKAKRK